MKHLTDEEIKKEGDKLGGIHPMFFIGAKFAREFYEKQIEEKSEKELKMEVDKFYKLRNGKKAYCNAITQGGNYEIAILNELGVRWVRAGGKSWLYENYPKSDFDVIAEWEEGDD